MSLQSAGFTSTRGLGQGIALQLLHATECAALASARVLGRGDQDVAKSAAGKAMLDSLTESGVRAQIIFGPRAVDGLVPGAVIGHGGPPEVDLAVYPIEGASLVARGLPNALSMIVAASPGGFATAPSVAYVERIVVGPRARGILDLDDTAVDNLLRIAFSRDAKVSDLTVAILDRPRHHDLIEEVRAAGARIVSLADGDIGGGLLAAADHTGVDCAMGVGGLQEAIVIASALRCLGGDMKARLWPRNDEERAQVGDEINRRYGVADLVLSDVEVAITGITGGPLLDGVAFRGAWAEASSWLMSSRDRTIRRISSRHLVEPAW